MPCYSSTMKTIHSTIYSLSLSLMICLLPVETLQAETDKLKIIRFYKLNSKGQQNRLIIRESRLKKTGCHNFATKPKVYRLTQIGFQHCWIYTKKNCEEGTAITGLWKGEKQDTQFSQGGEWLFTHHDEKGVRAKSWRCEIT